MRKTVMLGVALAILLFGAAPCFAQVLRAVVFECDPPTHYIVGVDCNNMGQGLTQAELDVLIYQWVITVDGSSITDGQSVGECAFLTDPYPVGSTVGATVSAYMPGGSPVCWENVYELVIPPHNVGTPCCGMATVQ